MAFMKTDVNYAVEFGQILDEIFPYESYYDDLWNQGEGMRYQPVSGKTFKIPSGSVKGARAANRDRIDGVFERNMNNDWQTVDLQMDREWDTMVDPMDTQETGGVISVPNAARLFMTTQKIPEQDAFASAKIAEFAGKFGGIDTTSLTTVNILAQWDAYLQYLTEQRVPRDQIRCKMTPAVYTLLKEAAGVTRFVNVENGARDLNRNIARLDGILIREVPSDMMKDAYDFTEGWAPASGAHQINMILYSPLSIAAPVKYDVAMMGAPSAQSKGKALYYERYYYGMFALAQKQAGIFANIGSAPSLGILTVTSVAGTEDSGDTVITVKGGQIFESGRIPDGLELYYSAGNNSEISLTYGSALPSATWVKYPGYVPFLLKSQTANKHITVALVNKTKGVVVAGGDTTLVVKA